MTEIKNKHSSVEDTPPYDFDVLGKNSFMYHWVKEYMDATYRAVRSCGYDLKGATLYDIGVGRGRSLAVFKSIGVGKVVGIDINAREVDYALRQKERLGVDLSIVIDDDQENYLKTLPADSCEVVSVMNALNFLTQEIRLLILTEVKRILKPGGVLIIADATKPSLMWFFNSLVRMPRIFSSTSELRQLLYPLRLLRSAGSNFFYFFNEPVDLLGMVFGISIYYQLDEICRILKVPPSTRTFVFTKEI